MTEAEKKSAVAALREILDQIEAAQSSDSAELLRLAALASWRIKSIVANFL